MEEVSGADSWLTMGQRQLLDLERLAFQQESQNNNPLILLPDGSVSVTIIEKGYDEIHVPAPESVDTENLVSIASMPDWAQPAFEGMISLNRVQSRVYETALFSADSILLCAPNGAGKTSVALLTILQQIVNPAEKYKILYLAPRKAMVTKLVDYLSNKLGSYDINVNEVSGDRHQIEETHLIVTTPEKWEILNRQSGDRTYTQLITLVIIDDIHLLNGSRGPVLESIVARTVRHSEIFCKPVRLVGLSATLSSCEDVASFLRVDMNKGLFQFDNTYRHVPLSQLYLGVTAKRPFRRFQAIDRTCCKTVLDRAGKCQCLIFVHSRQETVRIAREIKRYALADIAGKFSRNSNTAYILETHANLVMSNDLKELLPCGLAVHHAGLVRQDRVFVEDLFRNRHLQVLVSTATLAWGVNLTADTVIIKGTHTYDPEKGEWTELSPFDVIQMLGRAESHCKRKGEGIIITGRSELATYISTMNQQLPIESQFISKLADQLNAEIALGSIQHAREASKWLGYTYLYKRMLRNPTLYGLTHDIIARDPFLEERRADLVHSAANLLDTLVKYDRTSGYFESTELGRVACRHHIKHGTVALYNEHLKLMMTDSQLYQLLCLSEEFKCVTVRPHEKLELAGLLNRVPIPIMEILEVPSAKICILLQSYISHVGLKQFSLTSDSVYIGQIAGRLLRAIFEIALMRGWAQVAEKTLNMSMMVNKRMWSVQTPLRQFHGIPKDVFIHLENKDLAWEKYYDLSAQEIEELIGLPGMGIPLYNFIHQIPKLNLAADVKPITRDVLTVRLTITPDFTWEDSVHGYVEPFWVIMEDNDREYIVHHEYFMLKKQNHDEDHVLKFTVPIHEPMPPLYFVRVVSDRWLGSQTVLPVSLSHLLLPK